MALMLSSKPLSDAKYTIKSPKLPELTNESPNIIILALFLGAIIGAFIVFFLLFQKIRLL
jgi:hypothetical protein